MKMRKLIVVLFFTIIILASFVSADIESIKDKFSTLESVQVKISTDTCSPLPTAKLYVVENEDDWEEGNSLIDVRGEGPQDVELGTTQTIEVWSNPGVGDYDIILDCAKEYGEYDFLDPIDSLLGVGFTVIAEKGTGSASRGEKDIGDHIWQYDPEEPDLINEMLQLSLLVEGEDIILENITIRASGTGNDTEIDTLEIYADENGNGRADDNEIIIGDSQPAYTEDNGITTILLDYILTRGIEENILIVYRMEQSIAEGEFDLVVDSIYGTGDSSDELIKFSGLPHSSGTKTAMPEKTCLGELILNLEPNPAPGDSRVIAKMTGLTSCENRTIILRTNPCGSSIQEEVGSCVISGNGTGCEISLTALTSKTYHACFDKNGDGDMIDFGEYAFEDLVVTGPVPEINITEKNVTEKNVTEVNITDEVNITGAAPITGGIAGEFKEKLSETGSFFILLEITLLLILFVLIMIMFRLKPSGKKEKSEEKEEETGEE